MRGLSALINTESVLVFVGQEFPFSPNELHILFLAVFPGPLALLPVRPSKHSVTVSLPLLILSFILHFIGPGELSLSVHFEILPVALIRAPIRPLVKAKALYSVLLELSLIVLLITPLEHSFSVLHSIQIISLVTVAIEPRFFPRTIFVIVVPKPL